MRGIIKQERLWTTISSSARTPMVDNDTIEAGLRAALPAHLHTHVGSLARLLADTASRTMSPSEVRNRFDAEPAVAALIQTLAGTTIGGGAAAVSFGTGNSIGTVTMGDVAGRDIIKISPNIIVDLTYSGIVRPLPPNHGAAVMRMVEDYQAVFGGRTAELADLDAFLEQSEQSCALLLAPTGRGKTALLIHWLARLQAAAGWTATFAPISRRYQTATAEATLGMLASTLAAFYHETEKLQVYNTSPDQLRPLIADYLRREPSGGRLVVVLDGLDEAVGWDVGRDLFPRTMGPHLRVVASARQVAHKTRDDWLDRSRVATGADLRCPVARPDPQGRGRHPASDGQPARHPGDRRGPTRRDHPGQRR